MIGQLKLDQMGAVVDRELVAAEEASYQGQDLSWPSIGGSNHKHLEHGGPSILRLYGMLGN